MTLKLRKGYEPSTLTIFSEREIKVGSRFPIKHQQVVADGDEFKPVGPMKRLLVHALSCEKRTDMISCWQVEVEVVYPS